MQFKDNNGEAEIGCVGNDIGFYPAGTERMRIDSSGNVGIGVAPTFTAGGSRRLLQVTNGSSGGQISMSNNSSESENPRIFSDADNLGFATATTGGGIIQMYTAGAERMNINSSGLVTVAQKLQANGGVYISAFDGDKLITDGSQGGGSDALYIGNAQIQVSSDERIKKDIVNTAINATEELKKVRVVDFTWDDPTDQSYNNKNARGKWTGAVAQELISVFPHIINAPRDKDTLEVDNDSDRKWLVEYQNLVPVLIKAIQELEARIKTLEDA